MQKPYSMAVAARKPSCAVAASDCVSRADARDDAAAISAVYHAPPRGSAPPPGGYVRTSRPNRTRRRIAARARPLETMYRSSALRPMKRFPCFALVDERRASLSDSQSTIMRSVRGGRGPPRIGATRDCRGAVSCDNNQEARS